MRFFPFLSQNGKSRKNHSVIQELLCFYGLELGKENGTTKTKLTFLPYYFFFSPINSAINSVGFLFCFCFLKERFQQLVFRISEAYSKDVFSPTSTELITLLSTNAMLPIATNRQC